MRTHRPNKLAQFACILLPFAVCASFAIKAAMSYTSKPVYAKSWISFRQEKMAEALIGFKSGDLVSELKNRVGQPVHTMTIRGRVYFYFSPANRMTGSMGDKWRMLNVVATPGTLFSDGQVLQWQWGTPDID